MESPVDLIAAVIEAKSKREASEVVQACFERIAATCEETGERPEDGSLHQCVACRTFRVDRVDAALDRETKLANALSDQLRDTQDVVESLSSEVSIRKAQTERLEHDLFLSRDETHSAREVARELERQRQAATARLADYSATIDGLTGKISELNGEIARLTEIEEKVKAFAKGL